MKASSFTNSSSTPGQDINMRYFNLASSKLEVTVYIRFREETELLWEESLIIPRKDPANMYCWKLKKERKLKGYKLDIITGRGKEKKQVRLNMLQVFLRKKNGRKF